MRRSTILHLHIVATLFLLLLGSAHAQRRFPYQLDLDSRSLDTLHTPDPTSSRHRYRITAWGTYSMWEDTINSSVDPLWIYSFPQEEWAKPEWRLFPEGYPIYVGDDRLFGSHGLRINNAPFPKEALSAGHRYSMIVQGNGAPVSAMIVDWNFKGLIKQDAHANNSGWLHLLVEELPLTEVEICAVDSSRFPAIRVSMKVLRDSVRQPDFARNLVLTENGIPVRIDSVDCSDRTNSVSVAMVFDKSGSMAEPFGSATRISYTRSAGKKFIDKLGPADEAAIYSFSLTTTLDQSWTGQKSLLSGAIDRLQPDGWTAMNDAVLEAVDAIELRPASHQKAIVLLSDGEDNRSAERSITAVIARARRAGIPVFAIGLLLDTDDSLRLLAAETGGRYFSVRDPAAMDSVFASVAEAIFEQGCCSVYYTSPNSGRDGGFRQVVPGFTFDGDTLAVGSTGYHAPGVTSGVGRDESAAGSAGVELRSVLPNPMRDDGLLRFHAARGAAATIVLIDAQGRIARELFDGTLAAGDHEQRIAVAGLPSGRYFVRVTTAGNVALYPVVIAR